MRVCESLIGIHTQENKTGEEATKPTLVQGFRFKMINPFVCKTANIHQPHPNTIRESDVCLTASGQEKNLQFPNGWLFSIHGSIVFFFSRSPTALGSHESQSQLSHPPHPVLLISRP